MRHSFETGRSGDFMRQLKIWIFSSYFYWILLLLIGLVSYALMVGQLGFYWDDWQSVFLYRAHNLRFVWDFFAYDRPLSTWTFALLFPILGIYPVAWQIATLLIRWLATGCLVMLLLELFPNQVSLMRWVGVLLIVYPGFPLQSVSVAFSQHFLTYLFFSSSLLFMLWFAQWKKPRFLWLALALTGCLVQIFTMEYFTGLEMIRPVILWICLARPGEKPVETARKVFKVWGVFLIPVAVFVFFRFGLYTRLMEVREAHPIVILTAILHSPVSATLQLANAMLQDVLQMTVFSWTSILSPDTVNLKASATLASWGIGMAAAVLCAVWLNLAGRNELPDSSQTPFRRKALILAGAIIILGELPVWLIGRQLTQGKWSERFTLAPMLGVVLLLVIGIDWLVRTHRQKQILMILVLGLSIAAQIRAVNKYRLDWAIQRDYYWQLFWRAPSLAPGTAILSDGVSTGLISNFSMGFGLNSLYAPVPVSERLATWFFTPQPGDPEFGAPGYPISYRFRNLEFQGSSAKSLVITYAPSVGCVRVAVPDSAQDPVLRDVASIANLTHLNQIGAHPAFTPDETIFGSEPPHNWCFYYEKADLALQEKNWPEIIRLMDEANQKGYTARSGGELLPLMDAYVQTGAWEKAYQTSLKAQTQTTELEPFLCAAWERYATIGSGNENSAIVQKSLSEFKCSNKR